MSDVKYIGFDFETGGTDPDVNAILTAYFCALDKDLNIVDDLNLKVRPEAPYEKVEEEALKVNGIDLEKHISDPDTVSREEAGKRLSAFLAKNGAKSKKDKSKPRPLGHNVSFDVGFSRQLISKDEWESRVHYGHVCTFSMSTGLKDAELLPETVGNLKSLVKHFNIPMLNAHSAKDDTIMMVQVYGSIRTMLKSLASNTGGLNMDTLSMLEK